MSLKIINITAGEGFQVYLNTKGVLSDFITNGSKYFTIETDDNPYLVVSATPDKYLTNAEIVGSYVFSDHAAHCLSLYTSYGTEWYNESEITISCTLADNAYTLPLQIKGDGTKIQACLRAKTIDGWSSRSENVWAMLPLHTPTIASYVDVNSTIPSSVDLAEVEVYLDIIPLMPDVLEKVSISGVEGYSFSDYSYTENISYTTRNVKTLRLDSTLFNALGSETLVIDVVTGGGEETVTTFSKMYVMDSDSLSKLSSLDMNEYDSEGKVTGNKTNFILNMMNFFFIIPETYYPTTEAIVLGQTTTSISAPVINADVITIPLGNIEIPRLYNSVDVECTKYELSLPFIERTIELDTKLFHGSTINVQWQLSLYNGSVTTNVYIIEHFDTNIVVSQDVPVVSMSSSIGMNIPIKIGAEDYLEASNINGVLNNTFSPKIKTTYSTPVIGDSVNLITITGKVDSYIGYLEAEDFPINFSTKTLQETTVLKSKLQGGFYIL